MEIERTVETQYQTVVDHRDRYGLTRLGIGTSWGWDDDPRHVCFVMSRYKFVSKMLCGKKKVLEMGCGDAFFSRLVLQEVGSLVAVDFDPIFVRDANARMEEKWQFKCMQHDGVSGPVPGSPFDAAYSLDVIEHIPERHERIFMDHLVDSISEDGVLILGTPSIQSQVLASPISKAGHVNCKDHIELRTLLSHYFRNVFLFSMNDEVVHTGHCRMAHYLLAMGVGRR